MNTLLIDENSVKRSRRASVAIVNEPEFADFKILEDKVILSSKKNSMAFYKSQLTLPLHTHLNKKDIDYMLSKV